MEPLGRPDAGVGGISRPGIVGRMRAQPRAHRVEVHIAHRRATVREPPHVDRMEARHVDVTDFPLPPVPALPVPTEEVLHAAGEIRLGELHHEVHVVRHDHPVEHLPAAPLDGSIQDLEQVLFRFRGPIDRRSAYSARHHMNRHIERLTSGLSGHTRTIAVAPRPPSREIEAQRDRISKRRDERCALPPRMRTNRTSRVPLWGLTPKRNQRMRSPAGSTSRSAATSAVASPSSVSTTTSAPSGTSTGRYA